MLPAVTQKADAMKILSPFLAKFSTLISWVLSCFDRVLFKGHLPIGRVDEFTRFVDWVLKIRRVDFVKITGPQWSARLVEHAKQFALRAGRPWEYHAGEVDKDAWAKKQRGSSPVAEGLIGVLCVMEACRTFKLAYATGRPQFVSRRVPQRVLYFYFADKDLGLMHVRLQTWAPFTCQICVNGHDYVACQLAAKGLGFEQVDNAFVRLDDPAATQRIADRFAKLPWPKILERYARKVNPLLAKELKGLSHYWVTDQAEYATDILFRDPKALAGLFRRLLEYAVLTFSPKQIFAYLGRKWHERFDGEVQTRYKSAREPGACLKHYVKRNWLKMYDKLGRMLRVETVINQPGEFKVYRECRHRDGTASKGWFAMSKGVGNLHHYQSQAKACNERYLEALSFVDAPSPDAAEVRKLTERCRRKGRGYAGFNPAREEEAKVFAAVLAGDNIPRGFRNRDLRETLGCDATQRPERRRASAAIGRVLKRLHVRGLLEKVPRTRRWQVTPRGRQVLCGMLNAYRQHSVLAS